MKKIFMIITWISQGLGLLYSGLVSKQNEDMQPRDFINLAYCLSFYPEGCSLSFYEQPLDNPRVCFIMKGLGAKGGRRTSLVIKRFYDYPFGLGNTGVYFIIKTC